MNITGPIIAIAGNSTEVAMLTGGKMYPVVAPQSVEPPFVVLRVIRVEPTINKQYTSSVDGIHVQITTVAKNYHYTQRIDEAIRRAIDGYRGNVTLGQDLVPIDGIHFLTAEDGFIEDGELFRRDSIYRARLVRTGDPIQQGTGGSFSPDITLIEVVAGENLSTGRVVIIDNDKAYYFQPSNPAHAGRAIGVTKTSATADVSCTVQIAGRVTDPGISAVADQPCFVGDNGQILPAYPGAGLLQKCGVGTDDHTIQIDFSIQVTRI